MIVQAGLDAVCSTFQRPLRAGDLLQPAGARCAPFAAVALLLQKIGEALSCCRSSAPAAKGPHYKKPSPLRSAVGAAPRCERPHTTSTPETANPPCRRVCYIKRPALQLRTG